MIQIRSRNHNEVPKIADINRSEHVTLGYRFQDGELSAEQVDWHHIPSKSQKLQLGP